MRSRKRTTGSHHYTAPSLHTPHRTLPAPPACISPPLHLCLAPLSSRLPLIPAAFTSAFDATGPTPGSTRLSGQHCPMRSSSNLLQFPQTSTGPLSQPLQNPSQYHPPPSFTSPLSLLVLPHH
ncbi:putative DBH-like monooxygenase protein 2 [Platysternon megacephalum]|uniref:Putative DBH-like monooxygenase protein 2 n=1 Tax=Platysternon megacephalum TaxID=55544 RepID=A0A4D9DPP7_9SAUR|nr:putative DBH-like monooxygenase protein 2 [Platysternon megacephalum]